MILQYGGFVMEVQRLLFPGEFGIGRPGVILYHRTDDGFLMDLAFEAGWFDANTQEAAEVMRDAIEGWKVKREAKSHQNFPIF